MKNHFVFFVSILVVMASGQEAAEKLKLLHADIFRQVEVNGRIVRKLEGHVAFRQGATKIECDLAEQVVGDEKTALVGHVRISDAEQTLEADTVYFFQNKKIQFARGHVKNVTPRDTTTADRMTYFEEQNKLVSEGNVRIANVKEHSVLTGEYAEYFRDREYGLITGTPVLVQKDSLGAETTRILADTMEVDRKKKHTHMKHHVKMFQHELVATCGEADYFRVEKRVDLNLEPVIVQKNRTIKGDSLRLFLENSELKRAEVHGNALVTSEADTLAKGRWVNKLQGQKMTFYFEEKELRRILVEDQATSTYHLIEDDEYKGVNEISGDKIEIFLKDDKASRVLVNSSPDKSAGKYRPPRHKTN